MTQTKTLFDVTPKTQCEKLLAHFRHGGDVTSLEAYGDFGITQLARCISDLEKEGHRFNKPFVKLPSGKSVVRYSLCKE